MLPAIDLSSTPDLDSHINYKKREAKWKRDVSLSHSLWCLCGSYKNHFIDPKKSLICGDGGEDNGISDEAMAAIEDGEAGTTGDGGDGGGDGGRRYGGDKWHNSYLRDTGLSGFGDGNRSETFVSQMDLK